VEDHCLDPSSRRFIAVLSFSSRNRLRFLLGHGGLQSEHAEEHDSEHKQSADDAKLPHWPAFIKTDSATRAPLYIGN
jgi:hypothetical protein